MTEKSLGPNERERKIRPMPQISRGKCSNFERCSNIDDLADGLCTGCWDKTSYKDDLIEDIVIPRAVPPKSSKRGNMMWFLTI